MRKRSKLVMNQFKKCYEKKRILVTGGAGFIGSHLVETLVGLGAHVTVLDNMSTGSLNNLRSVVSSITLLYADIRSPYTCLNATLKQDMIFHLAAFISVPGSIKHPAFCRAVNIEGTHNLLDAAVKNNVKRLIFSSSSAVYGDKEGACSEADIATPQTPYAQSKLEGENLCQEFAKNHGLNTTILRYFNVYGPRQNPSGSYAAVVAKFTHQLLEGKPLTIFGDGNQTRDFVPVQDIVSANLTIGSQDNLQGEVFNIGSGKSINLLQLIQNLENDLNKKHSSIDFKPARNGDILHSRADCKKYIQISQKR